MTKRIIVIEDDPMAAKVLRYALEDEGYTVRVATLGRPAIELIIGREVALVIADVRLPDMDGFTLCHEIRDRGYAGPILLISAEGSLDAKIQGFRAGADDYVTKPVDLLECLARVNNLVRRFQRTEGENMAIVQVGDAELSLGTLTYGSDDVDDRLLTPTEMRMLEYLMRRPDRTVSRDELIQHVWGGDVGEDTNRIDVYIRRLRHKIERSPVAPRYLRTIRGAGYVFQPPGLAYDDDTIGETPHHTHRVAPPDGEVDDGADKP